ncbi:hypothetical protein J6590_093101, partial [Homalodisca vitripennis]
MLDKNPSQIQVGDLMLCLKIDIRTITNGRDGDLLARTGSLAPAIIQAATTPNLLDTVIFYIRSILSLWERTNKRTVIQEKLQPREGQPTRDVKCNRHSSDFVVK